MTYGNLHSGPCSVNMHEPRRMPVSDMGNMLSDFQAYQLGAQLIAAANMQKPGHTEAAMPWQHQEQLQPQWQKPPALSEEADVVADLVEQLMKALSTSPVAGVGEVLNTGLAEAEMLTAGAEGPAPTAPGPEATARPQQPPPARQQRGPVPSEKRLSEKKSSNIQQFEIDPARIQNGEDRRTTVMLRNVPKSCSQEDLHQMLEQGGLGDRITFLYVPFDKRKNTHCGFAFINFACPEDVLMMLYSISINQDMWNTFASATMPPALSYARLQGHEQLARHFASTVTMQAGEVSKRPIFMGGSKQKKPVRA